MISYYTLLKVLYKPFVFFLNKIKNKRPYIISSVFDDIMEKIDNRGNIVYYGQIPRESILFSSFNNQQTAQVGIILQGQVEYKNDFTLETLKLYRRQYPDIKIVLSTWENEVTDSFREESSRLNIKIIESALPENQGFWHVNCQIMNSHIGTVFFESDEDVHYLLKTRTDQRIYKPNFIDYLLNTYQIYSKNEKRILLLDSSYLYIPFYLCDYLAFGDKQEIIHLYSIPHENGECDKFKANIQVNREFITEERQSEKLDFSSFNSLKRADVYNHLENLFVPEVYIAFSFYKKFVFPGTLYTDTDIFEKYWSFIKSKTIIIDERDLLMYWPKYKYRGHNDVNCYFYGHGLNHARWLDLYMNYKGEMS